MMDKKIKKYSNSNITVLNSNDKQSKLHNKIKIDIRKTQYPILSIVAVNQLGWKCWSNKRCNYLKNIENKDYRDVIWNDEYVTQKQVQKLKFYQRINHFPGSQELGKKSLLAMNIEKMKHLFSNDFFPNTYILPRDSSHIKRLFASDNEKQYYIAKPQALSQGKGIFLFRNLNQLPKQWQLSNLIIQKYIQQPYLIDGLKFDFRIYVLLRSLCPLKIFVYDQGLARFATCKYQAPSQINFNNTMMHLTNYAINKKSPDFIFNKSDIQDNIGHKRSYTSVINSLRDKGINVNKIQKQIHSIIVKTILSSLQSLINFYKKARNSKQISSVCFQILGFDIMLDKNLTPYLIQVNHSPSFTTDTPLDYNIKKNLIQDTLNIIRVDCEGKRDYLTGNSGYEIKKISTSKTKELQYQQDQYQQNHKGKYKRIFPSNNLQLTHIYNQIVGIKVSKSNNINSHQNQLIQNNSQFLFLPHIIQQSARIHKIIKTTNSLTNRQDKSQPQQTTVNQYTMQNIIRYTQNNNKFNNRKSVSLNKSGDYNLPKRMTKQIPKQLALIKMKNLQIDLDIPIKVKKRNIKNNVTHSTLKSLKQYEISQPQIFSSRRRSYWATKNILVNLQTHKNPFNIRVTNDQKCNQIALSPIKISTIYYNLKNKNKKYLPYQKHNNSTNYQPNVLFNIQQQQRKKPMFQNE